MARPATPVLPRLPPALAPRLRALALAALLLAEAAVVVAAYQVGFDFECRRTSWPAACGAASSVPLRVLSAGSALLLVGLSRPALTAALAAALRATPDRRGLALHGAGLLMILAPRLFLSEDAGAAALLATLGFWTLGPLAAGAGLVLAFARPDRIGAALRGTEGWLWLVPAVALAAPEIAGAAQGLWRLDWLATLTFAAVQGLLGLLGEAPSVGPARFEIGIENFRVLVARQCSGVEGFALITGFTGLYLMLFRDRLRLGRALWLIPVAVLASWLLNVVRIAGLILIGAHVSPGLAVNGFHSHAGWLMFTLLALGLAAAAHAIPWLRREPVAAAAPAVRPGPPPLLDDPDAAQILPFVVFMASALLASTFAEVPGLWYPLRLAAMLAVLWLFRRFWLALNWQPDALSLTAGAVIGVAWVATAEPTAADAALKARLAELSGLAFAFWALARVIGTAVAVPLIEELVFRGYLMRAIDTGGLPMRLLAVAVSTAAFAALHDRWLAAALAGLVFAGLALRRNRLGEAVQAHAVANALIAGWAVVTGDWGAI
jgi:exosortase E/protease (VPEID-CTERM system)